MSKISLLLLIFAVLPTSVNAQIGVVTGNITKIRSHDITVAGHWFQLDVPAVGNCESYDGKILFRIKDDERGKLHISMLLAAKMANQPITVSYDDVGLIAGQYCYIRYLDI